MREHKNVLVTTEADEMIVDEIEFSRDGQMVVYWHYANISFYSIYNYQFVNTKQFCQKRDKYE